MNILIAQSQSQQLAAVITSSVNFGNLWKTAAAFSVRNHLSEVVLVQWVQKSPGCDGRKSHRGRYIPRYISAFSAYKDNIPLLSWRQEGARISMTILYPAQNINQHAAEWKPNPEAFSFVLFFPSASRPLSGAQLSLCWERAVNAANALGSPGSPSQQQGKWGREAGTHLRPLVIQILLSPLHVLPVWLQAQWWPLGMQEKSHLQNPCRYGL